MTLRNRVNGKFYKGDLADLFWQVEDQGAPVAPGAVILHVTTPAGVASTPATTAGTAPDAFTAALTAAYPDITIDAGPYYRYRLDLQQAGTYTCKWQSTGVYQKAGPDFQIVVEDTVY